LERLGATTGNMAIWNPVLLRGSQSNSRCDRSWTGAPLSLAQHTKSSYFRGWSCIRAGRKQAHGNGPQEYIGYGRALTTPEPGSMLFGSGTGLMGIAGIDAAQACSGLNQADEARALDFQTTGIPDERFQTTGIGGLSSRANSFFSGTA